jgi:hypothetical protein
VFDRNVVTTPRESLPGAVTDTLRYHSTDEVALLSHLLGRDLQHRLAPPACRPRALHRDVTVERQHAASSDAQTALSR